MRAVIWTDVFQCGAMLAGMLTVMIKVCYRSSYSQPTRILLLILSSNRGSSRPSFCPEFYIAVVFAIKTQCLGLFWCWISGRTWGGGWGHWKCRTGKWRIYILFWSVIFRSCIFRPLVHDSNNEITRNSSGDEIANVKFLYDDIVHALKMQ